MCNGYNKAIKNHAFSAGLATSCSPFMAALTSAFCLLMPVIASYRTAVYVLQTLAPSYKTTEYSFSVETGATMKFQ